MIVNQVARKHTSLALGKVELGDFLCELIVVILVALRIVDVEHGACKTRTHLTAVVAVHAQTAAHSFRKELIRELTKRTRCKDAAISGCKVLVHNEATVVDEAIVVN